MNQGVIVGIFIVFCLLGDTFFRDTFYIVWLVIGLLFSVFLAWFHINENRKQKKRNSKGS